MCEQLTQSRHVTLERPGIELATSRVASQPNHYTTRPHISRNCVDPILHGGDKSRTIVSQNGVAVLLPVTSLDADSQLARFSRRSVAYFMESLQLTTLRLYPTSLMQYKYYCCVSFLQWCNVAGFSDRRGGGSFVLQSASSSYKAGLL